MSDSHSVFLDVLGSDIFNETDEALSFIIGTDDYGKPIVKDFSSFSHLVIAGATGTGKSTLAHAILLSLIESTTPEDLRLVLCDTKVIEFSGYNNIPHLLVPIISDPSKISSALVWTLSEMNRRLGLINAAHFRSIDSYNTNVSTLGESRLPHILLVIDDVVAAVGDNTTWNTLRQLAQNGRASGIHLLLITQTPGDKRLADIIRSSIPARAVFNIFSNTEEKLLLGSGKNTYLSDVGEIIFCVMPNKSKEKIHCYPISDSDISNVIAEIKEHHNTEYDQHALKDIDQNDQQSSKKPYASAADPEPNADKLDGDEMLPAAVDVILETGQASVSMLQRRLKLGYARAARIVDEMEKKGIVGPFQGSTPRSILITKELWESRKSGGNTPLSFDNLPFDEVLPEDGANQIFEKENTADQANDLSPNTPNALSWWKTLLYVLRNEPIGHKFMSKPRWFFLIFGCLLTLLGLCDNTITFDVRVQCIVYGVCICVSSKVSFFRWIFLSLLTLRTGFIWILFVYTDSDQFGFSNIIMCALIFIASIIFAYKAVRRFQSVRKHGPSRITLHQIDLMSGIEFEEFTARLLRKLGYTNVSVTQASGDQGIDVLAQKDGLRYAIQCKNYNGKLGNTPVQEAFTGMVFYGCDIAVVFTNSTFTDGALELAKSTGVQLWDRSTLADMIHHAKL